MGKHSKQSGRKPQPYRTMRLVMQGKLPDARTFTGKALLAFEAAVREHFGELNPAQLIVLSGLMPLVGFLHDHTMITDSGGIAADWKWAWNRVFDSGMLRLQSLATADTGKAPTLDEVLAQLKTGSIEVESDAASSD